MKKMSLLMTLFVMAALTLAACTAQPSIPATGSTAAPTGAASGTPSAAASPSVTGTSGAQTTSTSAVSPTAQATSGATAAATGTSSAPSATGTSAAPTSAAATSAPTTSATSQAATTATTSANPSSGTTPAATGTASAGTGSSANKTSTPSASAGTTGTPQAGVNQAQFLRLSNLMNYTVQTNDNQQVGAVNSVIVERPMVATGQSTNTTSIGASAPFIRYVVVNVNSMISSQSNNSSAGTGSQILVPWQAFNFNNLNTSTNSSSLTASTSTLTLNVAMTVFANAPRVDVTQLQSGTANTWQGQANQYWAGQGVNASGNNGGNVTSQSGDMVVIGKQMNGFNVVGANNAILGQVADFLVDMKTGAIAYAVITPQSMNGQSFFIPLSNLSWVLPVGQNTMTNLGNLAINIPPAILQNAPSFGALNNLQLNPNWVQQVNQFWQSIQSAPVK